MTEQLPKPATPARVHAFRAAQALVSIAAFVYVFQHVDRAALWLAFSRVSFGSFALALGIIGVVYGLALVRWRLLLVAFAAQSKPPLLRLTKYYLIGAFYNTYLPGGVGGDVVRGIASRDAFGPQGMTSALAVVLVERVMGLAGLLMLTSGVALVHPLPGLNSSWLWGAGGLLLAMGAVLGLVLARRIADFAPAFLAKLLLRLPTPQHWTPLLLTLPLSILMQGLPAISCYILVSDLVAHASLLDALLIAPLALCAAFLPITISGAGVREAIFIKLYALVGVPVTLALAASLMLWLTQALIAAAGGVWMLLRPIGAQARD